MFWSQITKRSLTIQIIRRGVAQLVEHRSPKPGVAGSSPVSPATKRCPAIGWAFFIAGS